MNEKWYNDKNFWIALLGFLTLLIGQVVNFLKTQDVKDTADVNKVEVQEVRKTQEVNADKIDDIHKEVKAVRMGVPPKQE